MEAAIGYIDWSFWVFTQPGPKAEVRRKASIQPPINTKVLAKDRKQACFVKK